MLKMLASWPHFHKYHSRNLSTCHKHEVFFSSENQKNFGECNGSQYKNLTKEDLIYYALYQFLYKNIVILKETLKIKVYVEYSFSLKRKGVKNHNLFLAMFHFVCM